MTLTIEDVKRSLPSGSKIIVEQDLVDKLNNVNSDPIIAKDIRNNFLSYSTVVTDGRFKATDYLNAIKYVTHKSMGMTNKDAYINTFPNRYQNIVARGGDDKLLSSYVAAYNNNKLVQTIIEQSLIPIRLLNRDAVQEAINTLVDLMQTAKSELVKCNAANSILTHLKEPEKAKVELQIGLKEDSGLLELKNTLNKLAEVQLDMINSGKSTTKEIAHQKIVNTIDHSSTDVEECL
jgi:hypothetical protein